MESLYKVRFLREVMEINYHMIIGIWFISVADQDLMDNLDSHIRDRAKLVRCNLENWFRLIGYDLDCSKIEINQSSSL